MNDPRSMAIGWTALILAAGSGYYFARKDLNERRKEQTKQGLRGPALDWREKIERDAQAAGAGNASETPTGANKTVSSPTTISASSSGSNPPPNPKAPP